MPTDLHGPDNQKAAARAPLLFFTNTLVTSHDHRYVLFFCLPDASRPKHDFSGFATRLNRHLLPASAWIYCCALATGFSYLSTGDSWSIHVLRIPPSLITLFGVNALRAHCVVNIIELGVAQYLFH